MRQMTDFGRASMRKSFKNEKNYQDSAPESNDY